MYVPAQLPEYSRIPSTLGLVYEIPGARAPITRRATEPSPGMAANAPNRRRQRGKSEKLGYPPNNSSPPSPDIATLRPASLAALDTNQVFTPSIEGWSIASTIR